MFSDRCCTVSGDDVHVASIFKFHMLILVIVMFNILKLMVKIIPTCPRVTWAAAAR
jgi:hypothetical protein